MITVMNSAVMPAGNFGTYIYSPATVDDLSRVVHGKMGEWQSAVGYQQNIELIAAVKLIFRNRADNLPGDEPPSVIFKMLDTGGQSPMPAVVVLVDRAGQGGGKNFTGARVGIRPNGNGHYWQ